MRYPFDLVAHQAATLLDGFLGRFRWVRDRTARALALLAKNQPGYGTFLAFHGFGLEEAGDYAHAEGESRAAAELEPLASGRITPSPHVDGNDRAPGRRVGLDGAREALWSAPEHHPGPHLVAQVAVPPRVGTIRRRARAVRRTDAQHATAGRPQSLTNATALLWRLDTLGCRGRRPVARPGDGWEGHANGRCL